MVFQEADLELGKVDGEQLSMLGPPATSRLHYKLLSNVTTSWLLVSSSTSTKLSRLGELRVTGMFKMSVTCVRVALVN